MGLEWYSESRQASSVGDSMAIGLSRLLGEWTPATALEVWTAGGLTLAFALVARWIRGVARSGAVAGAVVSFLLYVCVGSGAFLSLVSVFVLAWATTRLGYARKQRLGIAERREGRSASQVLANLGVAAVCAVLFAASRNVRWLVALMAALAEPAADTVSSELGQAAATRARLITNWQVVPAGTDGGVSLMGTLGGVMAAVLVSLVGAFTGVLPWNWVGVSATAATLGMIADSYLGASLERRGWLTNNLVNLIGTLTASALALLAAGLR